MQKEKLFSVTAFDCRFDYYRGSGKGGQKRNKTHNAVRCTHKDSGAVGQAEDTRSQLENKRLAFKRMSETQQFKTWHKLEVARRLGLLTQAEEEAKRSMQRKNLRIEGKENGKWVEID